MAQDTINITLELEDLKWLFAGGDLQVGKFKLQIEDYGFQAYRQMVDDAQLIVDMRGGLLGIVKIIQ